MPELPTRILLTGFMGSGKSSLGAELARLLGYSLVDTDALIEERSGQGIPEIWEAQGEAHFRQLELELCRELADRQQLVIASGGGTVLDEERRKLLYSGSFVVNLHADRETLIRRIRDGGGRPLLFTQDIAARIDELLSEREAVYALADMQLDTGHGNLALSALLVLEELGGPSCILQGSQLLSPVLVEEGLLRSPARLDALLPASGRVFILTDDNVHPLHGDALSETIAHTGRQARWLSVPAGEGSKSMEKLGIVLKFLADNRAGRDAVLIGLGGGVVTDLAGLVATLYMRGISLLQFPTSLLGMVDAAIGGKTGINFHSAKNLVGSFLLPDYVACDPAALETLPQRELHCGLGEVVKYDMLSGEIGAALERDYAPASRGKPAVLRELVLRCSRQKCRLVSSDFREQGERKFLNFGHSVGHALESLSAGTLSHGAAVGLGMLCACRIAADSGLARADNEALVRQALVECRLPVSMELPDASAILELMQLDKKNRRGEIRMVLPLQPGELLHDIPVANEAIEQSLEAIRP